MFNDLEAQRSRFHPELLQLREELQRLDDFAARAKWRGQISGVYRRYRAELLVVLTTWAIDQTPGAQPTKFGVATWQKKIFGRSLNNDRLAALWCDGRRTPGDRGSLNIMSSVSDFAAKAFALYTDALDNKPDPQQIEQLLNDMLEHDLGL